MNVGDFGCGSQASRSFTVSLTLTVDDARALWSAAADRALAAPGMTLADVLDTIGPREDPAVAECIAMLTGPAQIAGCALDGFEVLPNHAQLSSAQILHLQQPLLRAAHA
jgi:hypothetical protein